MKWVLALFAVLLAAAAFLLRDRWLPFLGSGDDARVQGVPVRRGSLEIDVVERGNLSAAESVVLKSAVEGQTTILSIVEEGRIVEAGDVLVELDTAELVERRVTQEIAVQNAEAAFVKARQNLEIQKSQNRSEVARAERELEFARVDLRKYIEGDWPQERRQTEEEILLASEELTRAEQDLEWSERLAERGFLENTQLEADRLARTRAEITRNQKKRALELLEEYEFPRRRRELEADVEEKERELERVRLQADARLVDHQAEMRTSEARFDLETEKLHKLDSQIEKATIRAPVGGMVVYAQQPGRRWGNDEPIQEGAVVRERQELVTIPSTRGMVAEASLHESILERVEVGMPCVVTVDALPDRTFLGEVAYKAVLPDQNSWWANPDLRVYRTDVRLLETDPRLRPGMSCSIRILVDELEDVLHVPLQSVFLDQGRPVAFVAGDGGPEKRAIEVGSNDGKWVVVRDGLREGDTVLLSQPPGFQLAPVPAGGEAEGAAPGGEEGESRGPRGGAGGRERRSGEEAAGRREGAAPRAQ